MYAQFFGLRELPFNNTPDPRFFYSTPDHEEALASLIYAVQERKGFVLLTGEIGAGKTLVSRMMLRHFGTMIAFATINHAIEDGRDLLESICTEFEMHVEAGASSTRLVRLLHDYLLSKFAQNLPVVLVLDEAQNLSIDAFEQLRMIGNLEADDAKLLQIVIVGQPELQQMFATHELCQLRQRVFRNYHLPAMGRQVTEGYINHRLSVAGSADLSTFTNDAIDRIFEFAGGVPRVINTLCDNAMLSAYSSDTKEVDGPFVASVINQMMMSRATSAEIAPKPSAYVDLPRVRLEPAPQQATPQQRRAVAVSRADAARTKTPGQGAAAHPVPPSQRMRIDRRMGQVRTPVPVSPAPATAHQEQLNHETNTLVSKARSARSELDPLVRRAEALTARAELAVGDLDRREERLRNIDRTVSVVIRELRSLLDRAQRMILSRPAGPQATRQRTRQLAEEAASCRRVVDNLAPPTPTASATAHAKLPSAPAPADGNGRVLRQVDADREDIEGFRRRADQLRERLRATRSGLFELCGITSDAEETQSNDDVDAPKQNAATRKTPDISG